MTKCDYSGHLSSFVFTFAFSTPCFRVVNRKERSPFVPSAHSPWPRVPAQPFGNGDPSGRTRSPGSGAGKREEAGSSSHFFWLPRHPQRPARPLFGARGVREGELRPLGRIPVRGPGHPALPQHPVSAGTCRTARRRPRRAGPGPPRRREGGEGEGTGELAPACCAPGAHSRRRRSAGEGTASAPGATPVRPPELRRARAPGPENSARGTRIQVPDPRCAPGEERVPRPPCARPRAASAWTRAGSGPPAPAPRSRLGLPSPSGWGRGGCGAWRAHRSAALLLIRKCPPPTRLPAGPARPPTRCRCRPPADRCSQPLARDSSARPSPRVPTPLSSLAFAPTPPPPPRHSAGFV